MRLPAQGASQRNVAVGQSSSLVPSVHLARALQSGAKGEKCIRQLHLFCLFVKLTFNCHLPLLKRSFVSHCQYSLRVQSSLPRPHFTARKHNVIVSSSHGSNEVSQVMLNFFPDFLHWGRHHWNVANLVSKGRSQISAGLGDPTRPCT